MKRAFTRAFTLVVAAVALAACGSSTAPGGISIGGHWSIAVSALDGDNRTCSGTLDVNFAQSFNSFNGTYTGGPLTCTGTTTVSLGAASGTITDGSVSGQQISFSLDNAPETFTGTVNETTMTGATSWTTNFNDGNGSVTLNGSWTGTKQ